MKELRNWPGADDSFWGRLRDICTLLFRRPKLLLPDRQAGSTAAPTGKDACPTTVDLSGVFAVPDTEAWWRAVHQIIDQAERETVLGARNLMKDTNRCIGAVGAGEGIDLVRQKLIGARKAALSNADFGMRNAESKRSL